MAGEFRLGLGLLQELFGGHLGSGHTETFGDIATEDVGQFREVLLALAVLP